MNKNIRYLGRADVNTEKWNECISMSGNGLIYAYTWWLDKMCEQWSALVLDDYDAVMPLTWKKKFGFSYLYQPWFTASLGMFAKLPLNIDFADFLAAIPSKYLLWDFSVNEYNELATNDETQVKVIWRVNQCIEEKKYETVYNDYSRLCRRKLAKAAESQLSVKINEISCAKLVTLYEQYYAAEHPGITSAIYTQLAQVCQIAFDKAMATTYSAFSQAGEIVAFYLVLHDKKYMYSLLGGSNPVGKETGAFYLLTDAAIRQATHNKIVFRFEGSDIPGIAFFNKQFGSSDIKYMHIQRNELPFWAKPFKRL